MAAKSQQPKGRDSVLFSLNENIDALNLAEVSSITPAKAAFRSASVLLTEIRDSMVNEADIIELGLACADACKALARGTDGRRVDQLSRSVLDAIEQLTTTVAEIRRETVKRNKRNVTSRLRNVISRLFRAGDKKAIATWRLGLGRILHVFNTELRINIRVTGSDIRHEAANTESTVSDVHRDNPNIETIVPSVRHDVPKPHTIVSEVRRNAANNRAIVSNIHRNALTGREDADGQNRATQASAPGESSPPPLPRNKSGTYSEVDRYVVNTHTIVSDIRRNMLEGVGGQHRLTQSSVPGESPPLPPRVFFGRDELVERVVGLAENLTPIALIGAGGIGKTSTILTVLHDDRIKQRFGDNRWFIRCDQFPASRPNFLHRLSKVIGAGIENPEDLTPLRRFLSSKRMLIVLDNAESVLGMQGTDGREIYAIVDELSWFSNICLCITSRISIIPPHCETLDIPTLSMGAACDTFYRIYNHGGQSDVVNDILAQLDFHPLCITLLATVAQQNKWDTNRLTREWERRRTGVLDTRHSGSLATTIELSLASPMFQELGPDARGLLEVVAFFPQGVDENNLGWLFPTISNGSNIFDQFCILSLTHRSNGFIAMLAPLRDYLRPKDPKSSPLLSTTKECYFARLSVDVDPDRPGFGEAQWITSEDVNIEHLLDVFSAIDATSGGIWDACANFMEHLFWHKPRLIVLGPKIESLPDDHPSKPQCLYQLSKLFHSVGNWVERKRLLVHALGSWRERGDDHWVALTLSSLSDANRHMGIHKEGIQQAEGASEIFERVGDTARQARCLVGLAWLLYDDDQLDTAEETASRAINLLSERDEKFQACRCHRVLGEIYHSKGETEKAIGNFELALGIAASSDWHKEMCLIHFSLVLLFAKEGAFDDAHTHIERAKSHAVNYPYLVARAVQLKALVLYRQHRPEEARSEASSTLHMFRKLGAAKDAEYTRMLLGWIDEEVDGLVTPGESDDDDLEGSHIRMVTSMEPPSLPCTLLQVYPPAGRLRTVPPAYCLLLPHPHRHRRTRWRGLTPPWITNTRPHARSTRRRSTRFWGGF